MVELLLASQSPRRQELLASLGIPMKVLRIDVDETLHDAVPPHMVADVLAQRKAHAFCQSDLLPHQVLVTADTVVVHNGEVLGKPHDIEQAKQMLRSLSGEEHMVYTGVCLSTMHERRHFTEATRVWFKPLSNQEIDYYVTHFQVLDKAGAYGIQQWIGMVGVSHIEGCYYNVMGLPVARIWQELTSLIDDFPVA